MKVRHTLHLFLGLLFTCAGARADDAAVLACRALPDGAARLACYDAMPVGSAAAPTPDQRFGLDNVRRPADPDLPKQIESILDGSIEGWGPNTQFKLANGQVWKVSDGSSATLDRLSNPKVKLVRNAFGTTFIEFEGSNNSPKVRRLR
jgi:hypothetical protein